MYPQIEINLKAIRENAVKLVKLGNSAGLEIVGVTKGVCGDVEIARVMVSSGIRILGDARIQNIKRMIDGGVRARYMLIREPMPSEVEEVVKLSDCSLNADIETVRTISYWARKLEKVHRVIVMIDVGDRREGIMPNQVELFLEKTKSLEGIEISGFGTNVGCFGGILPTRENQSLLVKVARKGERILGKKTEVLSTGGTVVLRLVEEDSLPPEINQLRLGEAILLGTSTTDNRTIPWLRQDTFTLKAEVIEVNRKPSVPEGPRGLNALGHPTHFEDRGIRKRAIVALGNQDVEIQGIEPVDKRMEILGGSSDHLVLDVENLEIESGDIVYFTLKRPWHYTVMMKAMTSPYVEKKYIK